MIEIDDGFFINPDAVAIVKDGEEGQCVLYLKGAGPLDGFVLDKEAVEVADLIEEALEEE